MEELSKQSLTGQREDHILIIHTSDVHGMLFPYDFIRQKPCEGSLARVHHLVNRHRRKLGNDAVILLDSGDILQGQPPAQYVNKEKRRKEHLIGSIQNFMGYDAVTLGNHDIKAGDKVLERWQKTLDFPVLAANLVSKRTLTPVFAPYAIFERKGIRIAILGLTTPAVETWILEGEMAEAKVLDMERTAREYVLRLKHQEKADLIIALVHAGTNAVTLESGIRENAAMEIAEHVDGIDAILCGHDHFLLCKNAVSPSGKEVPIIKPAYGASHVGLLDIRLTTSEGKAMVMGISAALEDLRGEPISKDYMERFQEPFLRIQAHTQSVIGFTDSEIRPLDSIMGPSPAMTVLHRAMLWETQADLSLAAPTSITGLIRRGAVTTADLYDIYRFEDQVCIMSLSGLEIRNLLEYSYSLWIEDSPDSQHLLAMETDGQQWWLRRPSYDLESAYGIIYSVDVTKSKGERVSILRMANGEAFQMETYYRVAVNSHRASGGGEHMAKGAGLRGEEIQKRILWTSKKGLRAILEDMIRNENPLVTREEANWTFLPAELSRSMLEKDSELLQRTLLMHQEDIT